MTRSAGKKRRRAPVNLNLSTSVNPRERTKLVRAARLERRSIASFLRTAALDRADAVILEHSTPPKVGGTD